MRLYNPSGWDVEVKADKRIYSIPAFSEKDVWETDHVRIILKSKKNQDLGIVHLVYDENMEKRYNTYEAFKKAQTLEGLNALLRFKKECLIAEKQAGMDIRHKAGTEADKALINPEKFEKDIKQVEKWINEIENPAKTKRGLVGKKIDGPIDNADQSAIAD